MSQVSESKLYAAGSIGVATFLGGPLAAGVMVRNNFLQFGQPKQAARALWAGLGLTVAVFSIIAMVPSGLMESIPNTLIPGVYTAAIFAWLRSQMGERLDRHESEGGAFYSGWKTFSVALASLVATGIIGFSILMMAPSSSSDVEYQANWARVVANEEKANQFTELVNKGESTDQQLLEYLEKTVIPAWNDSAEAVKEMEALKWLDTSTVTREPSCVATWNSNSNVPPCFEESSPKATTKPW